MNYGHMSVGMHLEPHLIDAMRRLIRTGTWACNHRGMRLWVGTDGTFIEWQVGAQDVVNLLAQDAFAGVPRDPDTLADMLCNAGVFERSPGNGMYWTITLPGTAEVIETAVKLKHKELIMPSGFDYASITPVSLMLPLPASSTSVVTDGKPLVPVKQESTLAAQENTTTTQPGSIDQETGEANHAAGSEAQSAGPQRENNQEGKRNRQQNRQAEDPHVSQRQQTTAPKSVASDTKDSQSERLLSGLKKENAWLMREILQSYANKKLTGTIVAVPQGLGISHDELTAHGNPPTDLMEELQLKGWLWVDKTKPNRKLHIIDVNGRQLRMMVLRPDIAAGLGFKQVE
jgi:conjugal transfer pilus assembly protein TraI